MQCWITIGYLMLKPRSMPMIFEPVHHHPPSVFEFLKYHVSFLYHPTSKILPWKPKKVTQRKYPNTPSIRYKNEMQKDKPLWRGIEPRACRQPSAGQSFNPKPLPSGRITPKISRVDSRWSVRPSNPLLLITGQTFFELIIDFGYGKLSKYTNSYGIHLHTLLISSVQELP